MVVSKNVILLSRVLLFSQSRLRFGAMIRSLFDAMGPDSSVADRTEALRARRRSPIRRGADVDIADELLNNSDDEVINELVNTTADESKITLPTQVKAKISKELGICHKTFGSIMKTQDLVTKLQKDLATFAAGNFPPGMKAYSQPYTCPELDSQLSVQHESFTITIPVGKSCNEAREIIHTQCLQMTARIDLFVALRKLENQKHLVELESVKQRCRSHIISNQSFDFIGIPLPPGLFPDEKPAADAFTESLFKKLLLRLRSDHEKKSDSVAKSQLARQNVVEKAANLGPKDMIKHAVAQAMTEITEEKKAKKAKGKGKGKSDVSEHTIDYLQAMASGSAVTDEMISAPNPKRKHTKQQLAERKNRTSPGNGESLGAARGEQSNKGKAKGKAKGGKNANNEVQTGSAKGKGKGKTKSKGKGKWQ